MYDFEVTRETKASAADVWAVYVNVADWPSWNGNLKAARLGGDFASHTTGHVTVSLGMSQDVSFDLENVEPMKRFEVVWTVGPMLKTRMTHTIESTESGCRFTHAYHTGGIMAPFAFLNAASARESVPASMERIAQLAEARAAGK